MHSCPELLRLQTQKQRVSSPPLGHGWEWEDFKKKEREKKDLSLLAWACPAPARGPCRSGSSGLSQQVLLLLALSLAAAVLQNSVFFTNSTATRMLANLAPG